MYLCIYYETAVELPWLVIIYMPPKHNITPLCLKNTDNMCVFLLNSLQTDSSALSLTLKCSVCPPGGSGFNRSAQEVSIA